MLLFIEVADTEVQNHYRTLWLNMMLLLLLFLLLLIFILIF